MLLFLCTGSLLLLGQWSVEEAQDSAIRGDLGLVLKVTLTSNLFIKIKYR